MDLADRVYLLDNNSRRRRLLLIREEGKVRYLDPDTPDWFKNAVPLEMRRWSPRGRTVSPEETQGR